MSWSAMEGFLSMKSHDKICILESSLLNCERNGWWKDKELVSACVVLQIEIMRANTKIITKKMEEKSERNTFQVEEKLHGRIV